MAEISKSASKVPLWPTLKKKLGDAKKRKKQKKTNPFALQGLDKFALLMAELQAKKNSLVDKTGNSVSAVRYLSRSAQEWTASTIARTASRRKDTTSSTRATSEIMLLQHTHSKETTAEIEIVDFSQSFSFPDLGRGLDFEVVGDLRRESDYTEEPAEVTRDAASDPEREDVGCSGMTESPGLPSQSARLIRNGRLLLLEKGWARSPNSAVALMVALSACMVARVTKIGTSFFELLTIDLVFRWQRGKFYADFLQSLVARHIVPHLSIRVPRGLALLPLVRRKRPVPELEPIPKQSESESEPKPSASIVVPEESSPLVYPSLPQLRTDGLESNPTGKVRSPSSTRRLVWKLRAKMSKSPTPGSPESSHSQSSGASPRKSSKFSFSRRDKEKDVSSDDGWPDDEVFADSASSSKKRCILGKKCSFRKEKTSEVSATTLRRSPLGRNFSMEGSSGNEISLALQDYHPPMQVFDTGRKDFDLWLILGLLVVLLFLIVSRLSAIVATSLLFLVLSHAHRETSKYRMPRRDMARSLQRPGGRFDSLPREESSSHEFYKRGG